MISGVSIKLPLLGLLLWLAGSAYAHGPAPIRSSGMPELQLRLNRIRLDRVEPDRYEFDAEVEMNASTAAKVESLSFSSMRLNDEIPLFIAPLPAHLAVKKNTWTELPPLRLTIYAADLASLALLRQVVETHEARLQGDVRAGLEVPLLGRLWMGTLHPTAALALDQQVALETGAVDPWTAGGLTLGSWLEAGTKALESLLGIGQSATGLELRQQLLRSVVIVHTTYRVQAGSSESRRNLDRLGFWISPHLVVAPEEILEPWAYLPSLAVQAGDGSKGLNFSLEDIVVRPASPPSDDALEWRRSRGDFTVSWRGKPQKERLIVSAQVDVEVLSRSSSANVAVLQFPRGMVYEPLPIAACASKDCGAEVQAGLTVIREKGEPGQATILAIQGTPELDSMSLSRPLDEACFGSPVVSRAGILGMVGSERTVVPVAAILSGAGLDGIAAGRSVSQ